MTEAKSGTLSVAEERRQMVRRRILAAARTVGARHGLDLRMSDVADEAGLSKRTLFRHFGSRESLIQETFQFGIDGYAERVPRPGSDEAPQQWLRRAVVRVHQLNSHVGRLWWDLASHVTEDGDAELKETFNRSARSAIISRFTTDAWSTFGGTGDPPSWVMRTFGVHMSAFATRVLTDDFACSIDEAADATTLALEAVLAHALTEVADA